MGGGGVFPPLRRRRGPPRHPRRSSSSPIPFALKLVPFFVNSLFMNALFSPHSISFLVIRSVYESSCSFMQGPYSIEIVTFSHGCTGVATLFLKDRPLRFGDCSVVHVVKLLHGPLLMMEPSSFYT